MTQKIDWILWGEWFEVYWFHGCYMPGVALYIRERLGYGLDHVIGEVDGDVFRIYTSRTEWTDIGERYLKEVIQAPQKLEQLLLDIGTAADALIAFSRKLESLPLSDMSEGEYLPLLKTYHELHHAVWSWGMVPNVLDLENDCMRVYLKQQLTNVGLDANDIEQAFQALVVPHELSLAQKEERDMLRLATAKQLPEAIQNHWKTYRSIQFGWTGPDLSLEYFQDRYERLLKEGSAQKQLSEIELTRKAADNERDRWLGQLKLSSQVEELFQLYRELLYRKTHRMDALFLSYSAVQPILKKIAKDFFLSVQQVYAMYIPWLIDMIESDSIDEGRINAITQYSIQYLENGSLHLAVGDDARKIMAGIKDTLPKPPQVNELKGECGYPGEVVRGQVCIINRASEMNKFKDGDVLVSNVTDPSLLPVMKRASAFVTNQGGLTCHAAIVARELHTPCIVGTKIATHVFKDGDMVEVDARKGMVKKI